MTPAPGAPPYLWVDWGEHLRSRSLARRLGIELLEIDIGGHRLLRYIRSAARTLHAVRAARPTLVIATNPSLVLGLVLLVLRRWYGFALVSDAHYAGVRAVSDNRWLQRLLDFHNSRMDLVIATNDRHAQYLRERGCHTFVCPDPLPQLPQDPGTLRVPDKSVLLVCTFASDEPYEAVFSAFAGLQQDGYTLFVTGNNRGAHVEPARFPWVRFLGFVPETQYYAHLRACTLVMDLTTLEDCLVCGAYETLAAGKPLITSATAALQDYFGAAAVFTQHTPAAIAASVAAAYARREELARHAIEWAEKNETYLSEQIVRLSGALSVLASRALPVQLSS